MVYMCVMQGYIWDVDSTTYNIGVLHSVGALSLVLLEEVKFLLGVGL